ncbi:MAG: hypothetical protein ACE5H7_12330 [Acidiferrobacterales bacterium]
MADGFENSYETTLRATLVEVLRALITEGFELPIHWVAVSDTGSIVAGDCTAEHDPEEWVMTTRVEHYAGPGRLQLPVNIVCMDVRAAAVRVAVSESGEIEYHYPAAPWIRL